MLDVSTELNNEKTPDDGISDVDGKPARRVSRSRIYKLALLLAVIAISLYALSIYSIIHTRGGAG